MVRPSENRRSTSDPLARSQSGVVMVRFLQGAITWRFIADTVCIKDDRSSLYSVFVVETISLTRTCALSRYLSNVNALLRRVAVA